MKKLLILFAFVALVGVTACPSIDKRAALVNYNNVQKITDENMEFIEDTDWADSVKQLKKERNKEALELAREIAKSAGNELDDEE